MEKKFGLIGSTVSHSFSKSYFDEKFFREGLRDYHYDLYPLGKVDELKKLLEENPELTGLNVTVPYKEQVLKFLSEIDSEAKKIGAVKDLIPTAMRSMKLWSVGFQKLKMHRHWC
jgi:shikimate dehydrogenase